MYIVQQGIVLSWNLQGSAADKAASRGLLHWPTATCESAALHSWG